MPRTIVLLTAIAAAGLLALQVAHATPAQQGGLVVTFLDVGQGDSAWLRTADGYNVLVDGGKAGAGPTVVAYLAEHGVTSLDAVVATHPDADHIGGLLSVVEAISVSLYAHNGQTAKTTAYHKLATAVATRGIPTAIAREGTAYPMGCCVTGAVLHPAEPLGADTNNASIVLRVSHGSVDFLLTGDIEASAERAIMSRTPPPPLVSEILKISHHGSAGASSAEFLAAVAPAVAVISVGAGNGHGHPSQQVLDRLATVEATIHRTDLHGTVVITSSGQAFQISPVLPRVRPLPTLIYVPWLLTR